MTRTEMISRADSIAKAVDDLDTFDAAAVLDLAKALRPGCSPFASVMRQISVLASQPGVTVGGKPVQAPEDRPSTARPTEGIETE